MELQDGKISCPHCNLSIVDAQKLLIGRVEKLLQNSVITSSNSKREQKGWVCPCCNMENSADAFFCENDGTKRPVKTDETEEKRLENFDTTGNTVQEGIYEGKDNYYPEKDTEKKQIDSDNRIERILIISILSLFCLLVILGLCGVYTY